MSEETGKTGPYRQRMLIGLCLVLIGGAALIWLLFASPFEETSQAPRGIRYSEVSFAALPGWGEKPTQFSDALHALVKSCERKLAQPDSRAVSPAPIGGRIKDWRPACDEAVRLSQSAADTEKIRRFFEAAFTPYSVLENGKDEGLFTGYYEPLIDASFEKSGDYTIPIYSRPPELVTVDLGAFRDDLRGRRIAGQVQDGRLLPFASRAEINAGALSDRGLELLWAKDPVAVFFLQIQGSGRARLPDGRLLSIGYDGPNGHPYTSLGRLMVERKILHPDHISSPAIADWLRQNPLAGAELMAENASYIFFRTLESSAPIGAEAVPLTAGISLAVDRAHIPLGAPIWLSSSHPDPDGPEAEPLSFTRLMVAQDTGGAIKGAVRGDVFWGFGKRAEYIAGHMANYGRYWLFLPKSISPQKAAFDVASAE